MTSDDTPVDDPCVLQRAQNQQTSRAGHGFCEGFYDDDEDDHRAGHGKPNWDDLDDDDQFDPERSDEDAYDDFELDDVPDEEETPPEDLWTDSDWE